MITKYEIGNKLVHERECLEYIKNENFKVIDVGGSANGWTSEVCDAIVDFMDPPKDFENIKFFKFDITDPDGWSDLLKYCEEHGKFDFSVCSHTLEDITNPVFVAKQLAKISKQGYVSFPSKHCELNRGEAGPHGWRGCCHHRWIFDIKDDKLFAFPKLPCLEYIQEFDKMISTDENKWNISIYWKDDIHINEVNGWVNPQDLINKMSKLIS